MHQETIHKAFETLISQTSVHQVLKISSNSIRQMRYALRHGKRITLDTKIKYLQRAGYSLEQFKYNDGDLINLVRFVLAASVQTKALGAGYILDKWKASI